MLECWLRLSLIGSSNDRIRNFTKAKTKKKNGPDIFDRICLSANVISSETPTMVDQKDRTATFPFVAVHFDDVIVK